MKRVAACLLWSIAGWSTLQPAAAQSVTNAFQGFSARSDQPVKVEAERLEVREKDQSATFTGNVEVTQGDSKLHASTLVVVYEETPAGAPTETGSRQIRRLEASGSVVVTAKNQRASGDHGVFDMRSNTVVLTGNVIVAQGTNVIRGDKLLVDLTKQTSRVETASASGRVEGIFTPGSARGDKTQVKKP